jgi:uncharacterized protein (TIGR02996 family)
MKAARRSACGVTAALLLGAAGAAAFAQGAPSPCGSLNNGFGPFDYRTDIDRRAVVETHHFTPEIEMLIRGRTGSVGADLDYTLRAFPNHPRALVALMRLVDKGKIDPAPGSNFTLQCYFVRALQFRPDDTTVRMLYATWLNSRQRRDEALAQLAVAKGFAGDNGFTHYNLGLVYMDLGEPQRALEQAHLSQKLGFERPELKQRLVAANQWRDPVEAPLAAASAPAPAPR